MIHRKTPCDVCNGELVRTEVNIQTFMDGSEDTIYEERCVECGNLLYGWVKKTKQGDPELIKKMKSASIQNS